jgi:hypothetical protein
MTNFCQLKNDNSNFFFVSIYARGLATANKMLLLAATVYNLKNGCGSQRLNPLRNQWRR